MTQRQPSDRSFRRILDAIQRSNQPVAPRRVMEAIDELTDSPKPQSIASDLKQHLPRPARRRRESGRVRMVLGISTWNRVDYLRRLIETFEATHSSEFAWTLIVADDGSTDGTWQYLENHRPEGYALVVIRNHGARIAGQTNTIFEAAESLGFDFGFKADDDVYFVTSGWDRLYYSQAMESGFHHLVYHNRSWKPPAHTLEREKLRSSVAVEDTMGCFYTFTPQVLDQVGLFDEESFPIRGHSHIDFTARCCRLGFNEAENVWDLSDSEDYIAMWQREEYVDLTDWSSPEIKAIVEPEERARREALIADQSRTWIRSGWGDPTCGRSAVLIKNADEYAGLALTSSARFYIPDGLNSWFDGIFVLNLRDDRRKWSTTAAHLTDAGIFFEAFPGSFGNDDAPASEWVAYAEQGLTHPVERQINRKLIQSPGAWGYLLTMERLIRLAQQRRLRRILVFDDDVRLHREFSKLVEVALAELPNDFRVLFLGGTQRNWNDIRTYSEHLYHANDSLDGSFAVGLDASVFDQLLAGIAERTWPYDAGPLREVVRRYPDKCFVAVPNLVIPDVSSSSIRDGRRLEDLAGIARWEINLYRDREPALPRTGTSEDLVTVLITCRTEETRLSDTLESLRIQTHGNLEILLGLLRPPERTLRIAMAHARRDPRIRVFGVYDEIDEVELLNALLSECRGRAITVVDPGTVSNSDRFTVAWRALNSENATVVVGQRLEAAGQPPGRTNAQNRLEEWALFVGTQRVRPVVELVASSAFASAGGFVVPGELGALEIVDRLTLAGGHAVHASPGGWSCVSPDDRFEDRDPPWLRFHQQIKRGLRPAYRRLEPMISELVLHRPPFGEAT